MKQKSSLDGYELANEQNLIGTTDTTVTPAVNSYVGYNSPSEQSVTIAGDGSAEVTYYYDIKILTFAVNENVETSYTNPTYIPSLIARYKAVYISVFNLNRLKFSRTF